MRLEQDSIAELQAIIKQEYWKNISLIEAEEIGSDIVLFLKTESMQKMHKL